MKTDNTLTLVQACIVAVLASIVVGVIVVKLVPTSSTTQVVHEVAGASPVGSSFNSAKLAAINIIPNTSAASSTSILNTDSNDRYVLDTFLACSGVNGQGVYLKAATTSVSSLGLQGNANLIASTTATTTTTSLFDYVSTSTEGTLPMTGRVWPSGTYLTFLFNNTATTSATCTPGVHYLAS